ncbi:MAG: phenylalanine--tRNA ligase subunit alpha [Rhodospirillales bacterium]|nr:phenylalanine--tRNA ligase subunit alpha [Alphaproteobacteria bacterium]MCB9986402.1 phenylalanine--tRNA ligase subunit alpha [Rhodospirillales bacterium]USO07050.1 MAG: phenylalanine--tRNA ligase subunit alpha [Rhodospirillales bacterium]
MSAVAKLQSDIETRITAANDLEALEKIRVEALGKKGAITALMQNLGSMQPDERKAFGAEVNALKDNVTRLLEDRFSALKGEAMTSRLAAERQDMTLPVTTGTGGRIHPISQTVDEMIAIFADMGFTVAEGPDIEDDFHNFTALNFPPEHPARAMHDTFYLPDALEGKDRKRLLRTHTSPVQVRTMMKQKPPIRIIIPGRTYRSDYDMTHTPMFHQLEGLVIDKATHMGHLKGCLIDFCKAFFGIEDLPTRFRPSFFPFTEPSAEMDIGCDRSKGELKIGQGKDWLEILGCGMVHPNVLKNCGIDPDEYQGFAFGMGIERVAMLKYGIPDLRTFFEGDTRWLDHYGFDPLDRPNLATGLSK